MNKLFLIIILFLVYVHGFADDARQPAAPTPPAPPTQPVVPGAGDNSISPGLPQLPSFPVTPERNNQSGGSVREVERYELNITGAYPNGNTGNNVSSTIRSAEYILYSNRTMVIKLSFTNGSQYFYHLRNPRSRIETSAGVFRETFDTTVQVGREFLLEQYLSELTYNNSSVLSMSLMGSNRVIVFMTFTRKIENRRTLNPYPLSLSGT